MRGTGDTGDTGNFLSRKFSRTLSKNLKKGFVGEDIILPFLSVKKVFTRYGNYYFVRAPDGTPLPWVKMKRTFDA